MVAVSKKPARRTFPTRRFGTYLFVVLSVFGMILLLSQNTKPSMIVLDYMAGETTSSVSVSSTNGIDDLSLAKSQSFGFFHDITNEHWKLLQKILAEHSNHKYPEQPLTHNPHFDKRKMKYFNSYPAWWQTNYEPNFSCQFERRVGGNGNGDGPKWVCDPHRITRIAKERKAKDPNHPGCVIYSIGSNGDFSFEYGMQQAVGAGVCEFHIFDMGNYTDRMPADLQRAHFHPWGLATQDPNAVGDPKPGQKFYGLKDTVKLLGHENLDTIDVFKIDCEKCEWKTFQDWVAPGIPSLQQIQVEVHNAPPQAITLFDSLEEAGYVRFHKEPNIQFNDGSCLEYALLKLDKEFFALRNEMKKGNINNVSADDSDSK